MKSLQSDIDLAVSQRLYELNPDHTRDGDSSKETRRTLRTLMSNLPGMAYCCRNDEHWTMLFVSEGCLELTGYAPAELIGNQRLSYVSLIHADDQLTVWGEMQAALAARRRFRIIYRLKTAGQGEKWVWEQGHGIFSSDGELLALEGFVTDITDRVQAEQALREAELKYRSIFEHAVHGIYRSTPDGQFLAVNPAMARMLGYGSPEELIADCTNIARDFYVDADSRARLQSLLEARGTVEGFEAQAWCKDRSAVWVRENIYAVRDTAGALLYYEGSVEDITERKRAEEMLARSEEQYRLLFDNSPNSMWVYDADTFAYLAVNEAAVRHYGYTREEFLRMTILDVRPAKDIPAALKNIASLDEPRRWAGEWEHRKKDGTQIFVEINSQMIDFGGRRGQLVLINDVTERKHTEAKLLHNAFHDALTGLPNRNLFTDHLQTAVERAKRQAQFLFAVLFLDLDRFKNVNDSLGHTVGDQLLIALTRRIQHCLRPADVVARLGGDEFAILLNDLDAPAEAIHVAERVQQELTQPFNLGGHEVFTTASIGIALSTTGYETPEAVLRDADTVMYRAKAQGKARHAVFDKNMHARVVALLRLENDLRRAVEREELHLHYQPIVALENGHISGFEALVRWQHPELGLIPPVDFIPVAEETGLIVELGQWVLREACRQMRGWQAISPLHRQLKLSVNLSSRHFTQPNFYERIAHVLDETAFDPATLQLEITESILMENAQTIVPLLSRLRGLGVELAIDDFGTGYSSLSYLSRLKPIHTLKIDRSFISMGGDDRENAEIVRTIIMLAKNMGKEVVAEGIETPEQLAHLRRLKCTYGQGYLFSRPQDAAATEQLLRSGLRAGIADPLIDELSLA